MNRKTRSLKNKSKSLLNYCRNIAHAFRKNDFSPEEIHDIFLGIITAAVFENLESCGVIESIESDVDEEIFVETDLSKLNTVDLDNIRLSSEEIDEFLEGSKEMLKECKPLL